MKDPIDFTECEMIEFVKEALRVGGEHYKQWYLGQILLWLGYSITKNDDSWEDGIAP